MCKRLAIPVVGVFLMLIVVGCGSSRPETVPVSGTITLDGGPWPTEALLFFGCYEPAEGFPVRPGKAVVAKDGSFRAGTFGDDLKFLENHTDTIVLSDSAGEAQIVIAPEYQGKVMTSTSAGESGISYGWINRELIASGERMDHINPFGGEDRFWLGPEGGQFSIYFKEGTEFVFDVWQTPEPIDWGPWKVVEEKLQLAAADVFVEVDAPGSGYPNSYTAAVDPQCQFGSTGVEGRLAQIEFDATQSCNGNARAE